MGFVKEVRNVWGDFIIIFIFTSLGHRVLGSKGGWTPCSQLLMVIRNWVGG